jgi:uncharacterized protein (TIGR03437 family)
MRHFFALISLAAIASAQPVVSHVYNGGNIAGNLCPGLFVIITGSNLGAFGATSVLTVGGQPGQIVQNGSSQVFAIFPANLTPGPTTLTIAYNGQTSAPFAVTLVAYAPAMAQVNSAFFFPICSQCFDLVNIQPPGINAQNPAQPGTEVAALVTGLGATPLGSPTVTVGGQPATLDMVQQDGAQSEFYDVVFTVPNGLPPGGQPTTVSIGGVTSPPETLYIGAALPSITAVENSATGTLETSSHGAAPNSILALYVTNAGNSTLSPSTYPTTEAQGVQVLVNGAAVPIYALVPSANLINFQLPSELATSGTASIVVQTGSGSSSSFTIGLGPADVGVYRVPSSTDPNNGAILIAGTLWYVMPATVAASYNFNSCAGASTTTTCGQPAAPGDNIVIYWTGGGATTPSLPTGQVAPLDGSTLYQTVQVPTVTIGGINAKVSFSGIVPGSAGEYQLNVTIPATAPAGDQVPLVVTVGSSSDTVAIAIQGS